MGTISNEIFLFTLSLEPVSLVQKKFRFLLIFQRTYQEDQDGFSPRLSGSV